MAPLSMAHLGRCFDDLATPTASTSTSTSTFSVSGGFSDADYDEGDILDDLLQDTPATELPRSMPAPSVASQLDDNASTCSSTTVADSYADDKFLDGSFSSISISSSSSSITSAVSPQASRFAGGDGEKKQLGGGTTGAVPGGGRRRRRRNRGRMLAEAADSCASDAGAGAESSKKSKPKPKPKPQKQTGKGHKSSSVTKTDRSRHPTLRIGLDLDAELQLKSKVRGDICLTLVLEEEQNVAPRASPEIRRNAAGQFTAYDRREEASHNHNDDDVEEVEVTHITRQRHSAPGAPSAQRRELCHLRVGRLNLRRRWWVDGYDMISHIPPPVVAGVAVAMPVAGFAAGWVAANWSGYWPW